jgi:hypothetical protein
MSSTLPQAHEAVVAAIRQDTPGTDLPRYIAVLDALIAWSVARPKQLAFHPHEQRSDVIRFIRVGSKAVFWSTQVTRGSGPRLEIHLPPSGPWSAEERAQVMETLNQHMRSALLEGDRLRIGFGALKNVAARTAVLALMERLLDDASQRAQRPVTPATGGVASA